MEEQRGAALDALLLWSIWSRSRINESGVKGHASRERGVRIKLSEEQHCIHLHPQEEVSVMLRRIVVAQTILLQPEIPWHEQVRIEETVRCHQRCLVAHCQLVVLDRVRGDVSPRVDVHEAPFAEFCIHCVPCKPRKVLLSNVPR